MGDIDLSLEEIDVRPGAPIQGLSIRDAQVAQKTGLIILAMKRPNQALTLNPQSSYVLQHGDRMLVMGEVEKMQKLQAWQAGQSEGQVYTHSFSEIFSVCHD